MRLAPQMQISLAFAGAHQQRPPAARAQDGQRRPHAVDVFGMRHRHHAHAAPGQRIQQLGHAVAAVAQPQPRTQRHHRVESRMDRRRRKDGEPIRREPLPGFLDVPRHRQPQGLEQLERTDAAVEVMPAVDQHRDAFPRQQHRHQRHQVGLLAGAVEGGQDHRARSLGGRDARRAGLHGLDEAQQFVQALALDAHRDEDGAALQIRHGAVEQLSEELARLLARQVAGAARAAADFLDERGVGSGVHGRSVRRRGGGTSAAS